MYTLKSGIKKDPERRWALADRIFFGHGACHILAGVFLQRQPLPGFHAERIVPADGLAGNHIYVTDGTMAFDYHGYSSRLRLLRHHATGWSRRYNDRWTCKVERVSFDLLSTGELNSRKMLGPDQYWGDPIPRARAFIDRINHRQAAAKAMLTVPSSGAAPSLHLIGDVAGDPPLAIGLAAEDVDAAVG